MTHAPELDVMHARQARRGRHAFIILVISLVLGLLVVFGAWAYFSGGFAHEDTSRNALSQAAPAASTMPLNG
jgi:hypothetical protein